MRVGRDACRLPKTLRETLDHLAERQKAEPKFTYEIIVVDDGSPDMTAACTTPFVKEVTTEKLRILRLHRNRGKGGAVIAGVLRARGRYILFADADGATAVTEIGNLERRVKEVEKDGLAVGVGSRAHLVKTDAVVKVGCSCALRVPHPRLHARARGDDAMCRLLTAPANAAHSLGPWSAPPPSLPPPLPFSALADPQHPHARLPRGGVHPGRAVHSGHAVRL